MKISLPTKIVSLSALLLAIIVAACAAPAGAPQAPGNPPAAPNAVPTANTTQIKKGGVLKWGLSTDPTHLDPHIHNGAAPAIVKNMLYDTLTRYNDNRTAAPGLAVSWDNPDPKTYTFKLRDGVKFHDGSPLTADDVKFSIERILDKKTGATRNADLAMVSKVEVIDPLTVKFTLSEPNTGLLSVLARETTAIMSKKWVEAGNDPQTKPNGTGAFKFVSWEKGVKITVAKFADYWEKDKPYLDGIDFLPYPDDRARLSALQSGAVDAIDYVPWRNYEEVVSNKSLTMFSNPQTISALYLNTKKAPFDNVKVRQAVAMAVDQNAIVKAVFFGNAVPATSGFLPPGAYGDGQTLPFKFDPDGAKKLLADAGYNGQEITIVTAFDYSFLQQTAELTQAALQAIGMKVKLDSVDFATFGQKFNKGEFDILTSSFGLDQPDPNFLTQVLAKGSLYSNRTGYVDPKFDDLLLKGRSATTEAERVPIYRELNQYALQQLPLIPLVLRQEGEASQSYVKGFQDYGAGMTSYTNGTLRFTWMNK